MIFKNLVIIASEQESPTIGFMNSYICLTTIKDSTEKTESINKEPFENRSCNELQLYRDQSWIFKSLYHQFIPPTNMTMIFKNLVTINSGQEFPAIVF